jgi:hypothetical protein
MRWRISSGRFRRVGFGSVLGVFRVLSRMLVIPVVERVVAKGLVASELWGRALMQYCQRDLESVDGKVCAAAAADFPARFSGRNDGATCHRIRFNMKDVCTDQRFMG